MTPQDQAPASSKSLEKLLLSLPSMKDRHAPGTPDYERLKGAARREIETLFGDPAKDREPKGFAPFGDIVFPYRKMGAIDSLDLFGLDELIIFSFYWTNRGRYRRAVDIGANLGLHCIAMSRAGFSVRAYEPDPQHFKALESNLAANACGRVQALNRAVSSRAGEAAFIRLLGNTTGSHLAGSKKNPYGQTETISVGLEAIGALRGCADLFKIDAEGHEREILSATDDDFWAKSDALIEIGSPENAEAVFRHLSSQGVHLFAQKTNWNRVSRLADMPTSYREGTLFITSKEEMPWS